MRRWRRPKENNVGEFYCPDCHSTFDLVPDGDEECPNCGSTSALPTSEINGELAG